MKQTITLPLGILFINALLFIGCINYEQETHLNTDGSGSVTVHYWAKENNVMWLSSNKLGFDESKIREQYKSPNITVKDVKVELDTKDSTKHVRVNLDFKDINKLSEVSGFKDNTIKWEDKGEAYVLTHTIKADTSAGGFGMNEYTLTYTYHMPADVISSSATKTDGKTLVWKHNLSQLANDIIMTATVKKSSGVGGNTTTIIIIAVLAIVVIGGILFLTRRKPASI